MDATTPTEYQQALIRKMLSRSFPGVEELQKQLINYKTREYNDPIACGSFAIYPDKSVKPANIAYAIPVEGLAFDGDGVPIEYLLHVDEGYANELEVVVYPGKSLDVAIPVDDITIMTHAERKEYEKAT